MSFDEFINGPLLWIALVFMTIGLSTRACMFLVALYKHGKVDSSKWSSVLGNLGRLLFPYHKGAIRKPFSAAILYTFHLCMLTTPLWLEGHLGLLRGTVFEWSGATLPTDVADAFTLTVLVLAACFLFRRIVFSEARRSGYGYQIIITLLVFTQFLSGYLLAHGLPDWLPLSYSFFVMSHTLLGSLILMGVVFLFYRTRLNPDKCVGCGSCHEKCPTATLVYKDIRENRHFEYQPYQCVACANCVKVCQEDAMQLVHFLNFKMFFQLKRREIHKVPLTLCQCCNIYFMPEAQQDKLVDLIEGEGDYVGLCRRCKIQHTAASSHFLKAS